MIKDLVQNVVARFLRIRNHVREKNSTINILDQLSATRRVLVFMPNKIDHFALALKSLEALVEKRPGWQITVVTKLETVSFIDNRLKVDILPYSKEDLNLFGFPRVSLRRHFDHFAYDLALDLKLSLDLLCIRLFQLSRAPLRACLFSGNKTAFYNFYIRINPLESLATKYDAMIKYITITGGAKERRKAVQNAS